jgi:AcrR family transcriptional regulator
MKSKSTNSEKESGAEFLTDLSNRRVHILNTTTKFIARHGFWGLTLREVAAEEGITEAGLLYYFKTKEGLLIEVLNYRDAMDRLSVSKQLGLKKPLWGTLADKIPIGLKDLSIATMQRNAEQPEIVRLYSVLQGESLSSTHPAHEYFGEREESVLAEFAIAAHRDNVSDPDLTARQVLAAMDGIELRWLQNLDEIDLMADWRAIIDLLIPGVEPKDLRGTFDIEE